MKKTFHPFDVLPDVIEYESLKVNAFHFIPIAPTTPHPLHAIFTHGFTACKNDVIQWAFRLLDLNIPSTIFDLPGHLLGAFHNGPSLKDFLEKTPFLFWVAAQKLKEILDDRFKNESLPTPQLLIGGHSLGALFAIQAASLDIKSDPTFSKRISQVIAVGFGLNHQVKTHLFESELYQKTLHLRGQLVSKDLSHEKIFKWIKDQKLDINMQGKKVYLLTGKDDAVVGPNGGDVLKQMLETLNIVTLEKPDQLPHHRPELAGAHIFHFLKKQLNGQTH